jgi:hypothetical protein
MLAKLLNAMKMNESSRHSEWAAKRRRWSGTVVRISLYDERKSDE